LADLTKAAGSGDHISDSVNSITGTGSGSMETDSTDHVNSIASAIYKLLPTQVSIIFISSHCQPNAWCTGHNHTVLEL